MVIESEKRHQGETPSSHPLLEKLQQMGVRVPQHALEGAAYLSLSLLLLVRPGARKEGTQLTPQGEIQLSIQAQPVEGAANKAIIKYLSRLLGVSAGQIEIAKGEKSKVKKIHVHYHFKGGKKVDYFLQRLEDWHRTLEEGRK